MQDEQVKPKKSRAKKDPAAEPGNATRLRAGKRAEEKKVTPTDAIPEEAKPEEVAPIAEEAKPEEVAPAEEEKTEAPAEAEAEKATGEETPAPEGAKPESAIDAFAAEEDKEPEHAQKYEPVGEYTPPETGASHEEHVDAYHNALMYGDSEGAKQHYGAIREHQFAEDNHRRKAEDQEKQQGDEYGQAADEVHSAYPHLNLHEDNVESDKIMALAHVYQSHGDAPGAALRKAAHELHGAKPAPAEQGFSVGGEVNSTPVPAAEEIADSPAADKVNSKPVAEEPMIPDMEDRKLRKQQIADVPAANAKQETKKEDKKSDSREEAIARMKKARGQA